MAIPPPRHPFPYVEREVTPPPLPMPQRISTLERDFHSLVKKLDALIEIVKGPDNDMEKGLHWKVNQHDKFHRRLQAVWGSVLVSLVIAVLLVLLRLSWIVQANRLP